MSSTHSINLHACIICVSILVMTGCSHGKLEDLDGDDHAQYLLSDGSRTVTGDLNLGGNRITNVAPALEDLDALNLQQAKQLLEDLDRDDHARYLLSDGSRTVTGDLNLGSNRITNVAPALEDQDALNLQQAKQTFVSGAAGSYSIVAAGRFGRDGAPRGPAHNGLRARPRIPVPGQAWISYQLRFDGYQNPDSPGFGHTYVVKGAAIGGGFLNVNRFTDDSIEVRISADSTGLPAIAGFMVEISQF